MPGIADIRKNYSRMELSEKDVDADPVNQFSKWWSDAIISEIEEPNAMTLATASQDGMPSARIVLLKDFDEKGFVFYTNYKSFKGQQLAENPRACLVFFWKELERQVRVTGLVTKIEELLNDTYFHSRPVESQLGAVSSPQSNIIPGRDWLEQQYKDAAATYKHGMVPRPEHWGGYLVTPVVIEFWQGRPGRLHDRLQYSLKDDGTWIIERLAP
jgi:pyridoxamine 5'-phosphate oxidase